MKAIKRICMSSLAAVLVPSAVTIVYLGSVMANAGDHNSQVFLLIVLFAFLISLFHVVFLGLPAVYFLNRAGCLKAWSSTLAGFIAGCVPVGIWRWPIDHSKYPAGYSYWDGNKMVEAKINGIPTMIGWMDYITSVCVIGSLGALAGISFWIVWSNRFNCPYDTDVKQRQ